MFKHSKHDNSNKSNIKQRERTGSPTHKSYVLPVRHLSKEESEVTKIWKKTECKKLSDSSL